MKKFKILLLLLMTINIIHAQNQSMNLSGVVISQEDLQPIIGASVQVGGTEKVAITDIDGKFSISANIGDTLIISCVGMTTEKICVKGGQNLQISMKQSPILLNNVVVTALGIKREEKALGYSVQKLKSEELQKVQGVDVATSLTGKVAGLMVKNSTDFGNAPTIVLRGESPLLVIDGVPYANMTMRDIAAEDIESMSVLKGATASALYGYRGSNGAIMIVTKNGTSDKAGVEIQLTSNTMFTAGYLAIPDKQAVYGRGTTNTYDMNSDKSWGAKMNGQILNQWDPIQKVYREYEYNPVGKDNFKNFLEQGYITNNTLSIGYQGKVASVRSSVNWTENKGLYPNSKYSKYGYTLSGDINLEKFKLTSNVSYHKQTSPNIGFNGYTSYDPMYTLLIWTACDYDIRDYKNNYWLIPGEKQNFTYESVHNNPYYDRYQKTKEINRDIFNATVGMSYDILPWMKLSFRSGLDFYLNREELKVSKGCNVSTGNTGAGRGATWIGKDIGAYATGRDTGYSLNNDLILTGEYTFFDKLSVEGLFGGTTFFKQDDSIWGNTVGGISIPEFFSLNSSVEKANVGSIIEKQQVNSLYGRFGVSWNRMLYADVTYRVDWSSTLDKDNRSYGYPSVSGSFIPSELFKGSVGKWLDMWKIRGSYTVSKTPPAIYATNTNYNVTNSAWGNLSSAKAPLKLQSGNVRPEAASTYEIGTQGIFFGNRLAVDFTYYNKLMYDLLVNGSTSEASGFTGSFVNSEEKIARRGIEITVSGTPVQTKDWRWDISVNWSKYARYYKNIDEKYSSDNIWVKKGNRVDAYVLKDYAYDNNGNHIFSNGKIQFNPYYSVFGYSDPDWIWGINSSVAFKDFSLGFSFDGRVGGLTNTMTESYLWTSGSHPKSLTKERELDAATPGSTNFLGEGVKIVSGSVKYDKYGNVLSDDRVFAPNDIYTTYSQYVKDMHDGIAWGGSGRPADCYSTTFIKLRELSLTYQLPKRIVKSWAKNASVSLVGQNLWFWAKDFKYSDPDGGTDNFNDPSVRYIGFNIKLTL
jgi:TonB-linked outer membrane protein, SusC/RagA family/TonB-dependent outer membrane receptor, SusC/RagA subfamily, signature region